MQRLIVIDRFGRCPTTSEISKTSETKEVINLVTSTFNLYVIPTKSCLIKGGRLYQKKIKNFVNIEIEYCSHRMHHKAVERAIQTMKTLIIGNIVDGERSTENFIRASKVIFEKKHRLNYTTEGKPKYKITKIRNDNFS